MFVTQKLNRIIGINKNNFLSHKQTHRHHSKYHKQTNATIDQQTAVCTKYNNCMETKKQLEQYVNYQDKQSLDSQFQIPSELLQDQATTTILVQPTIQYINSYQTDKLIQTNLRKKKAAFQEQKKIQKQYEKQTKKIKQNLQQNIKKIIKDCPKIPLQSQKRPQWNHTIFDLKTKEQQLKLQQQLRRQRQQRQKQSLQKNRIQLKDCNQRIRQYKQKQKKCNLQRQQQIACKHNHSHAKLHSQKYFKADQSQNKVNVQKNAQIIIKKMQQDKLKQIQQRKIIQGKIKAIQISSKKMLKKCKKKPVDPTIQFILEIKQDKQNNENKPKQKKISISQNLKKEQQNLRNSKKTKLEKNKSTKSQKPQTKRSQTSQQIKNPSNNQAQSNQQTGQLKKFFFWDIPIYKQDYEKINIQKYPLETAVRTINKPKSFRSQINQYLQQKKHRQMQQQIQKSKQQKIQHEIQQKKQQFLAEYDNFLNELEPINEIFWNEDQVYKLDIRNNRI